MKCHIWWYKTTVPFALSALRWLLEKFSLIFRSIWFYSVKCLYHFSKQIFHGSFQLNFYHWNQSGRMGKLKPKSFLHFGQAGWFQVETFNLSVHFKSVHKFLKWFSNSHILNSRRPRVLRAINPDLSSKVPSPDLRWYSVVCL